jgi:hypothetical protein
MAHVREALASLERHKAPSTATARREKLAALSRLALSEVPDAASLLRYHECLAFLHAWPDDGEVLAAVEDGLATVAGRVLAVQSRGRVRDLTLLAGSGLPGTPMTRTFTWHEVTWLLERFRSQVQLDRSDQEGFERVRRVLPALVTPAERAALDDPSIRTQTWLHAAGGGGGARYLEALAAVLRRAAVREEVAAALYEQADPRVTWWIEDFAASRTHATLEGVTIHPRLPEPVRGSRARGGRVGGPGPVARHLDPEDGLGLLELARRAVLAHGRSGTAFFRASADDVHLLAADEGVAVALAGLVPEARAALASDYAFLVLVNGVPVGHGRAEILFGEAEVRLERFDTFRDGPWTAPAAAVLRSLASALGVQVFRIHLGRENGSWPASLAASLGFRSPADGGAARSGRRRRHVLFLNSRRAAVKRPPFPRSACALDVTSWIGRRFHAGRGEIVRSSVAFLEAALPLERLGSWTAGEVHGLERLAPVLARIDSLVSWPAAERARLVKLLRAKGAPSEAAYARLLAKATRLRKALEAAAAS